MTTSNAFNNQIKAHLDQLAANDPLFAETLKKPNKNIADCGKYILSEVQRMNVQGMADSEVFALAVHYYDEDDLKAVKTTGGNVRVVVNHVVELSQEEKDAALATAKQKAIDQAVAAEQQRLTKKKAASKPVSTDSQASLF